MDEERKEWYAEASLSRRRMSAIGLIVAGIFGIIAVLSWYVATGHYADKVACIVVAWIVMIVISACYLWYLRNE